MDTLRAGSKLYHYSYGPMTVKEIDGRFVIVSIDDMQGLNTEYRWPKDPNKYHKFAYFAYGDELFRKDSIGYWIFEDPKEVAKLINSGKTLIGCPTILAPWAMEVDKENVHDYYVKNGMCDKPSPSKKNAKTGLTEAGDVKAGLTEVSSQSEKKEAVKAKKAPKEKPANSDEVKAGLTEIGENGEVTGLTEI